MEQLADILQYLKDHPEVTWSGAGLTALAVLSFPVNKLFAALFRKPPAPPAGDTYTTSGPGEQNVVQGDHAIGRQENIRQDVQGDGTITTGIGDVKIEHYHAATSKTAVPCQLPHLDSCFRGREQELAKLLEQLHPGKIVAVCGPGGMGKSALTAQAVHRLPPERFPSGIVFHSFYHKSATDMALRTILEAFQDEKKEEKSLTGKVRGILAGKKALLILDGAEDAEDLKAVLALRSTCGVLITSRKRDDADGFRLDLAPLAVDPAAQLVEEHSGISANDPAVQGICRILGGWPVGLRIAGRYLSSTGESAATYLRWLEKRPFRMLANGEHQEDNATLLLERSVAQVSEDAVQVLRLAGMLAFAPILLEPVAVIQSMEENQDDLELRSMEALGELVRYGLLDRREEQWQISHPLIHTYARTKLPLSGEALERLAIYLLYTTLQDLPYRDLSPSHVWSRQTLDALDCAFWDSKGGHCLQLMERLSLVRGLWWEEQEQNKENLGSVAVYLCIMTGLCSLCPAEKLSEVIDTDLAGAGQGK